MCSVNENKTTKDEFFMREALRLAHLGVGWVDPNPAVGCVLVRDGEIVGRGYHTKYGLAHAERDALKDCEKKGGANAAAGATAYVTLEPCSHTGKQPPCTQALIAAGIKRVVVGQIDPNSLVSGRGIQQLRNAGIEVDVGVLQSDCEKFNRAWRHFITTGTPYVIMKYAMSANGDTVPTRGEHTQITGSFAQVRTHKDRMACSAIMVGAKTVAIDDPQLTSRLDILCNPEGETTTSETIPPLGIKQPLRIVLSASANVPLTSKLVKSATPDAPVLVIVSQNASKKRVCALKEAGVSVELLPCDENSQIKWENILATLGKCGVVSLLVEGGPTLHSSLVKSGCVSEVQAYCAGKMFMGSGENAQSRNGHSSGIGAANVDKASVYASDINSKTNINTPANHHEKNSEDSNGKSNEKGNAPKFNNMLKLDAPEVEVLGKDVLITWRARH